MLDADHAGLEDVKNRIVEYLAVRKLRQERGVAEDKVRRHPDADRSPRHGQDVRRDRSRALNREFVRMSLGGVHDEAEIRGHRRTYIGAMPDGSCARFATPGR